MKAACLQLTIVLALISSLAHARREPFTTESSHKKKTYRSIAETINFQVPKRYNDTLDNLLTCSSPEKTSSLDRRCKSFKKSQYRSIVNDLNRMARKLNQ